MLTNSKTRSKTSAARRVTTASSTSNQETPLSNTKDASNPHSAIMSLISTLPPTWSLLDLIALPQFKSSGLNLAHIKSFLADQKDSTSTSDKSSSPSPRAKPSRKTSNASPLKSPKPTTSRRSTTRSTKPTARCASPTPDTRRLDSTK